jgi:GT2 family glycosyltransferase/glycosyltransferase involved in cell wall biosynthesis/SAM-dependent methyltransferase
MNGENCFTPEDNDFTGERVIPGKVDVDLFNEHLVRYEYARSFCSGRHVLDTGCGTGYGAAHLAKAANSVIGIDYEFLAILYAREHFAPPNVLYLVGDCHHLPFPPNHFDVVTSFELIEHLANAKQYLQEIRRVLRLDGTLIISTPNRPIYHERRDGVGNPFHVQEWDIQEFVPLLKTVFPFVEVRGETHLAALGILGSGAGTSVPAVIPSDRQLSECDYFVCVCSDARQQPGELVFVPGSANVLRERERHIHALTKEVHDRDAHLARLEPEFEEKAAWADKLNRNLVKTQSDYAQLSAEHARLSRQLQEYAALLSKATRWKRAVISGLLLPADLSLGATILATELVGKTLRLAARRSAPIEPVSDFSRCSVVIVTWEGKELLSESLPPLVRAVHAHGADHEIIVVDNGSTDGTEEYIRTHFPEIRVLRSDRNLYFGGGNNLGVGEAHNDVIVLLNNDMIVHEDFLAPLLEPFRAPDVFAVASQVFLADPRKRREETGKTRAAFNGRELEWRHDTVLPSDEAQDYVPVFWGHGGAVAVDRKKFLWLGGFDRLYDPFYVEDADISYAAWKIGWRCLLAVKSKVIHKHRSSTARFGAQFISQIVHRNQYLFLWKQFTDLDKLCAHFLRAPRARMRRAGVPGIGVRLETKAFLGALKRLPRAVSRRLRLARWVARTDQEVLDTTSSPADEAIQSSHIDFAKAPYTEHLGSGWYDLEAKEGKFYRWTGNRASIFLRTPEGKSELVITGWAPALPEHRPITLTVTYSGQQKEFLLKEGAFQHCWQATNLSLGVTLELQLAVDQTVQSVGDARTLGLIIENIGFTPVMGSPASSQPVRQSVSLSNPSLAETHVPGQKRILMICAYLPCLGTHGGGNMMFNLIRTLSRKHRIRVLSFYERESELEHVRKLSRYCESLEVIYRGQSFEAQDLFGVKPPEISREFYHRRMERLVRHYVTAYDFDLIQCEYLQTAHFAGIKPEIPAVLTNHEVLSFSYERRFQNLTWGKRGKLKSLIAWMRMLNYEERILRRFNAVVVLTEAEAKFLSRYAPQTPVYCHPMGVDCDYFVCTEEPVEQGSVLFVGNFRHSPNASGALWLLERIWPGIRQRCPQAELNIVGDNPTPAMQAWQGKHGITITGWVEDVRPHLARAAVVVAPLFEGAGMRTKVLEAWAMGKAVVGTQLALEGLASSSGEICLIANDEAEFAARTCDLLEDQVFAQAMGTRAHGRVKNQFSWESFADLYDHIYEVLKNQKAQKQGLMISPANLESIPSVHKLHQP